MKYSILLFSCFGIFMTLMGCRNDGSGNLNTSLLIKSGVLDLEGYDLVNNSPIALKGEWEFYWGKLLSPEDFERNPSLLPDTLISFPSYWNDLDMEGKETGGKGFATYRLLIKNVPSDELFAIKIRNAMTAYRLWVNNELLLERGRVGINKESSSPEYFPDIQSFRVEDDPMTVIIQISNFHHAKGGMRGEVVFGELSKVVKIRETSIIFDIFLLGAIFIMSIYHLGLFLLLKEDKSILYFGLLCLFVSLRIFVTGEIILVKYFVVPWELLQKIEYITYVATLPTFLLYVNALYPKVSSAKLVRGIVIIGISLVLLIISTPSSVFSYIADPYQYLFVLGGIYVSYILYRSIRSNDDKLSETLIFLFGFGILFATVIYDILHYHFLARLIDVAPFGVFIFILSQSFLLSRRFSSTFKMVEVLSNSLQQKVTERTIELEQKNESLEQLNKEKDGMMGIVAHDLRAPFNKILGFSELMRLTGDLNEEQREYLGQINNMVSSGVGLIHDILDMNAFNYDDFKLKPEDINLEKFIYEWKQSYELGLSRKYQILHVETVGDLIIRTDKDIFTRILDNLLTNAMKFSESGKNIWIVARTNADKIQISVKDEGLGLTDEDKKLMFNQFQKLSARPTAGENSNGLGLSIIKTLVAKLNGEIEVESELGVGSEFSILLPKILK